MTTPDDDDGWWTIAQVVAWTAFRSPLPLDRLIELTASRLTRPWPERGFVHGFIAEQAALLLEAMESQAADRVWHGPARTVDRLGVDFLAHVDRLRLRTGVSIHALAAELRHDCAVEHSFEAEVCAAHNKMMAAVAAGRLHAFGRRAVNAATPDVSAVHEQISATRFLGPLTIELDNWVREDTSRPEDDWAGYHGVYFDLVRFHADQVVKLWLPGGPAEGTASLAEVTGATQPTTAGAWVGAPASSATMPGATVAPSAAHPKATDSAVRQWLRERVTAWPADKPAPSESDDWAALNQHFAAGLTRAEFRSVRKEETPAAWRKQGPRKPWGEVGQSANQSANPTTQN